METQKDLEIGIGSQEATSLKPAQVKIVSATIETVGTKNAQKVVFLVKHPDKEEIIKISELKFVKGNQITTSGTWLNKDDEGLIRKGSSLAILLQKLSANVIKETEGKDVDTELDSNGYLCFKAY